MASRKQHLRRDLGIVVLALAVALGGGSLPLLEVPGLELGLCTAALTSLLVAPVLGFGAARRSGENTAGPAPVLVPFLAAAAPALGFVALVFAASSVRAAIATPCRPWGSAALFAWLALPSALLAPAVAVCASVVARGRLLLAAPLYAGVLLASLAGTAADVYFGPAAYAHDHLLGVWPGPIYDEALAPDARLVLFRAGTLAWGVVALGVAAVVARRRACLNALAPASIAAVALLAAGIARAAGGGPPTRAQLSRHLGTVRTGPRCVVHLATERGAAQAERALRDCEYDAAAVARALGLARPPRATVWIYRTPEEKLRLVGAGRTSYTKPWLAEIHVNDEGIPHPLLRHELVHALASVAAPGPLHVPARHVVGVNLGLVEGLAVAVDVPSGDEGVHAWARAMRDEGRLPPLAALLGSGGFLAVPASRAYVAAGSFLRWLRESHGPGAVLSAYAEDDVARGAGAPLSQLEFGWQRFLDGVRVSPALAAAADARFARGSLFARVCAREIAGLERDSLRRALRGRAAEAEHDARRASSLAGGDPAPLRTAVEAWRAAGDLARAEAIAREAIARASAEEGRRALRSSLHLAVGDLRLRAGDAEAAASEYRTALTLSPGTAETRTLHARLAAARDRDVAAAVVPWLLSVGDPALALARVAQSQVPLARYLLARAQLARGAPRACVETLSSLDPSALPDATLTLEARRLRAEALCRVGSWEDGIAAWRALGSEATEDGARERAEDAALRCAFERDTYAEPVSGDEHPW